MQLELTPPSVVVGSVFLLEWSRDAGNPRQFPVYAVNASGGLGVNIGTVVSNVGNDSIPSSGSISFTALVPGPFHVVAYTASDGTVILGSSNQIVVLSTTSSSPPANTPASTSQQNTPSTTSTPISSSPSSSPSPSPPPSSQESQPTTVSSQSTTATSRINSTSSSPPNTSILVSSNLSSTVPSTSPTTTLAGTASPSLAANDSSGTRSTNTTAIIIGVAVGVIVLLLILVALLLYKLRRSRKNDLIPQPFTNMEQDSGVDSRHHLNASEMASLSSSLPSATAIDRKGPIPDSGRFSAPPNSGQDQSHVVGSHPHRYSTISSRLVGSVTVNDPPPLYT